MGESICWLPKWKAERLSGYLEMLRDPRYAKIVQQMPLFGREFSLAGALPGASGNFSVRLGTEWFVITPQGGRKGELTNDSFITVTHVDWSQKVLKFVSQTSGVKPSSDTLLHHCLYVAFPDCSAIVHMHMAIDGPKVELPYPVTQQEEVSPLVTAIRGGSRAVNLVNHSPAEGGGASIIIGREMEETFQYAIDLANRHPLS